MPTRVHNRSGGFEFGYSGTTYTVNAKVRHDAKDRYTDRGSRLAILEVEPPLHVESLMDLANHLIKENHFQRWIKIFMEPTRHIEELEKVLEVVKDTEGNSVESTIILRDEVNERISNMTRLEKNWINSL